MSWHILKRDVKRILRVPKAWIIVLGIMIIPALYAWFNIRAFWDPYGNTGNIRVAVANVDQGATSDLTGDIDVGSQVIDQLKENDQLGWQFMDENQAQQAVESGDVYAAIVIPQDFSENLLSVATGDFTQPNLQYYVNEKASAVAPKMTDTGASQLDQQITSAFKNQLATAVTDQLKDAGESIELQLLDSKDSALNALGMANQDLENVQDDLGSLESGITDAQTSLAGTQDTLADVNALLTDVQTALSQAETLMAEAQAQIIDFADEATAAYTDGINQLADASSKANTAITEVTQGLETAGVRVDGAIDDISAVIDANAQAIETLQGLLNQADLDPALSDQLQSAIDTLTTRNESDQQLLSQLQDLKNSTSDTVNSVQSLSDSLDEALAASQAASGDLQTTLTNQVPQLNAAMSELSASAGSLSGALDANKDTLAQASELLADLDAQLGTTLEALGSLDTNLTATQDSISAAQTDITALAAADQWGELSTITGLDPDQVASFISSPIEVEEQVVYPVNSYGSGMAALFTNLSLWVGAFMLMVMFKLEVDTEDAKGVTVRQAYMARFSLLSVIIIAQALIVSIGDLILGVQTVNPLAFVGTSVLIGLVYLSVIYALSVALGHVGRGLCVVLVIMQIPGASGLYPIEVMPGFFRAIYPL
ncbi:YhgE/Pip family protein, partial [Ancrocorticia populi]|uniref:YhgE/Pip family protein n=1 Tax=Ancrocorticia populi TaxID=2175228 RepID=UPI003F93CF61